MTECILFDSDGTLVDSEILSCKAIAIKFKELGIELCIDDLMLNTRGKKMAGVLETLSRQHGVNLSADFLPSYRELVNHLFETELKPIDGIDELLQSLDIPIAVVSNGPREKIEKALNVCGLTDFFADNIYSAYELNLWKPDPQIYLHAAQSMGFQAEQCAVIEDSLTGVEAGVKANIPTYFYNKLNETCPYPEVEEFHSMYNLRSLLNL